MDFPPLLVTLDMEASAFDFFTALRAEHFPKERNYLDAHITLFHHLPGDEEEEIRVRLREVAEGYVPFTLEAVGLWMLGFGVAYRLRSTKAAGLRAALVTEWQGWLTPQDRDRPFSPHITVQNKAKPEAAKALYAALSGDFHPFEITATGLRLYRYLGGPWQEVAAFTFAGSSNG